MHNDLVVVAGLPGSGKTVVGRHLAANLHAAFLDKDTLTRPLAEQVLTDQRRPPNDRESAVYLEIVRPLEYQVLMETAFENLKCGVSVVVAAPFIWEVRDPEWFTNLEVDADIHAARLTVVWVYAAAHTLYRRLIRRGASRDEHKLANWEGYVNNSCPELRPVCDHVEINNNGGTRERLPQVADLVERLSKPALGPAVSAPDGC